MSVYVLIATLVCILNAAIAYDWTPVDRLMAAFIANQTFPGTAIVVIDPSGDVVLSRGYGNLTYGEPAPFGADAPVDPDVTLFDMASLTKILGGTTLSALLFQSGLLPPLSTPLADARLLGPAFAAAGKQGVTLHHLLTHSAGFPPDPVPGYWESPFGCPASSQPQPPQDFDCSERILAAVLAQPLATSPGTAMVYSDLSLITLAFALGKLVREAALLPPGSLRPDCASAGADRPGLSALCSFEAAVRVLIFDPLNMTQSGFLPPLANWPRAAPTWRDDDYRHATLQGAVSDENAYASGGVSGHAGIFATGVDAGSFLGAWGWGRAGLLNATTVATFTTVVDPSFSSRALGWDTQSALDTYRGCGAMSDATYTHTGYTGTQLCVDPVNKIATVQLASRGYPNKTAHFAEMQQARQALNTAVLNVIQSAT